MTSVPESPLDRPWEIDLSNAPGVAEFRKLAPHLDRAIELQERQQIKADAFLPEVLTQLSLPYRDPGDVVPLWERRNGHRVLTIQPAVLRDRDNIARMAYPSGATPRLFLIWLTTEVKRRAAEQGGNSPMRVELGENLEALMRQIGIGGIGGGKQRRVAMDQLSRLVHSRITLSEVSATEAGKVWSQEGQSLTVASAWKFWHAGDDDEGMAPLVGSYIDVSKEFCEATKKAVPLSMNVLNELKTHPMRMDIYAWVVRRLYYLRRESHVSWAQLHAQFGSSYTDLRKFRAAFKKNLLVVRIYYPHARVYVAPNGLILRPSKRHIPEKQQPLKSVSAYDLLRELNSQG